MKKVVLNISDIDYEKFKYEALWEKKSIHDVIRERIFFKPFCAEVEEAYDEWATKQLEAIMNEEE